MESSNFRLPALDSDIVNEADVIYRQMMNNTKHLSLPICSLCKTSKGIKNHWHASDLGKCYRHSQLSCLHPYKRETDPISNTFLQDGHENENVLVKLLSISYLTYARDQEFIINEEVKLGNDISIKLIISCHPDLIISNHKQWLVEFKSTKDWFFKNIALKGLVRNDHYGQIQTYLEATNLEYGLLFVKNRHNSHILPPFVIQRNREYYNKRIKYLAAIQYINSQKNIISIPREYTNPKCDECKFCEYNKMCWEE